MWHCVPLTLFWFTYMGSLGIVFPYFSLYLKEDAGLSGAEIGLILAVPPLMGMFAQPFWGRVADRTGARSRILVWLSLISSLGYLALGMADGFLAILLTTAVLSLFSTAILPITTSVSLAVLREAGLHAFGYVRAWGTIGYFIVVVVFPWIVERYQAAHGLYAAAGTSAAPALQVMFPVTAALVFFSTAAGFFLPRTGAVALHASRGDWRELLRNPPYLRLLLFSLAANLLLYGPMWLFPIYVRARGGDVATIRGMWIVMLVFEIPLVLATGSGLKRLGSRGLLAAGVLAGGLRWLLCAGITDVHWLYPVQALHGLTVVGLILGSPLYLDDVAPEKLRSTAQGILSMVSVGIAGILSNIGAGWLIQRAGIDLLYWVSGIGCIVLGGVVGALLPSTATFKDRVVSRARTEPA
jgi:MFS transporter, PPP family, 3-phenylpropionic acid transporter